LPGGFVRLDEDIEVCVQRELEQQAGVSGVYLEQLYTFGQVMRDARERVITVAHYALIPSDRMALRPANEASVVAWFSLNALPTIAFDHGDIVTMAHERLAAKFRYSTIAFQFMPETFTLGELQEVYEIILRTDLDKRNFRKWVLALEQIEETSEERRDGHHRPARLYRVKYPHRVDIIR